MPQRDVTGEAFSDAVRSMAYPFSDDSMLEYEDLYIGTDLVVDAVLYLKRAAQQPISLGIVDGTVDEDNGVVRLAFLDSAGETCAETTVNWDDAADETGRDFPTELFDADGLTVGIIVFDRASLLRFIGRSAGKLYTLYGGIADLVPDVVSVSRTEFLRAVVSDGNAAVGDVEFLAGHGTRFRMDADGTLRLDLLGDAPEGDGSSKVATINGIAAASLWIATHPQLNVRVDSSGDRLRFVYVRDTP